jgi:hypothetical protein
LRRRRADDRPCVEEELAAELAIEEELAAELA